jgi:hypothetical protein
VSGIRLDLGVVAPGRQLLVGGSLAFAVCASAITANAQSAQDQSDFSTARSDALIGTSTTDSGLSTYGSMVAYGTYPKTTPDQPEPLSRPPVTLNFLGPVDYYDHTGTGSAAGVALEGTPELKLGFLELLHGTPFQLSGFLDEDSDRYTGAPANMDKLDGQIRIDLVGSQAFPDRQAPTPYVSYSPQKAFDPFFSTEIKVTQDFAWGINKLWDFLPSGKQCDGRYNCYPTWELGLQVGGQHRLVSTGAGSNALILSPSIKWEQVSMSDFPGWDFDTMGQLSASVGITITRRWYSELSGVSEQTWAFSPIATAVWVLPKPWFGAWAALVGTPELDFQAAYNHQQSNVTKDTYHQWAVGPVFRSVWTFGK